VRPVPRRDLAVLAVGLAVAAWLLVRAGYGALPRLDWWLPAPLAVLAVAEAAGARFLATRLSALRAARAAARGQAPEGSPRPPLARPVEPMLVARLAVLAQASAYVGAVFLGAWLGVLAFVGPAAGRLRDAGADAVAAALGVLASAALIAAALWLESACRVPPDDDAGGGPLAPSA
jgi:Protein of unknown function (DUF3180)